MRLYLLLFQGKSRGLYGSLQDAQLVSGIGQEDWTRHGDEKDNPNWTKQGYTIEEWETEVN